MSKNPNQEDLSVENAALHAELLKIQESLRNSQGIVRAVTCYLNSFDNSRSEKFVEHMAYEHRTLQQNFTRLCVAWLTHLGRDIKLYDDRNEASVKLGKLFLENVPEDARWLPLI